MDTTALAMVVAIVASLGMIYKDIQTGRIIKQYQEERKDLLNRIMAKDLNDYKNVNNSALPKGMNPIRKKETEFEGLYE